MRNSHSNSGNLPIALLVAIVALGLVLRVAILSRPIEILDAYTLSDDTYLALKIAKNIGQGHGPSYGEHYTNGFQPLSVLLVAPLYALFSSEQLKNVEILDRAIKAAAFIVMVFDLLSIWLLAKLLHRRYGWSAGTFTGAALWAAHPTVLATSLNGLETSLALFFFLLSWLLFEKNVQKDRHRFVRFTLGGCLGLAVMARIDLAFAGTWIVFFLSLRLWRRRRSLKQLLNSWATLGSGFVVVYGPWLGYSWWYTRQFYPVSASAARLVAMANVNFQIDIGFYYRLIIHALLIAYENSPLLWILSSGVILAGLLSRRSEDTRTGSIFDSLKQLRLLVLFGLTLTGAYVFHVMAWWAFARYLFPVILIPIAIAAAGVDAIGKWIGRRDNPTVTIATVGISLLVCLLQLRSGDLLLGPPDSSLGYRNLGVWASRRLEKGTIVGASQTGALAYYAPSLKVINLDGVVNRKALESRRNLRHMSYIREQNIEYLLLWQVNLEAIRNLSQDFRQDELEFLGTAPGFRS